jgi:putative ABC transport system permease protein
MLALGIGANGAIFTLVNSAILRPVPYAHPENLVFIWETKLGAGVEDWTVALPNFKDWRDSNHSFEDLGAFHQSSMTVGGGDEPRQAWATVMSTGLFPLLRARPMLGRYFLPEDGQSKSELVVILGYDIWMQLFNGDRDVVNKSIVLNDRKYTVIGVMPRGFEFPIPFRFGDYQASKTELWTPLRETNLAPESRASHYLFVLGRLKPGVELTNARSELDIIAKNLERQYSGTNRGWRVKAMSFEYYYAGDIRLMLLILLGAVSFLILIACANIANLRFSQSLSRQNEFAIRSAMGCSRGGLIRLLLIESLLLSLAGGAIGLVLAQGVLKLLVVIGTTDPRLLSSRLDGWVISYTLLVSMITAILFGLLPALRASKTNLMDLMKVDGQTTSLGWGQSRLSKLLMIVEVALSVVLLIGAGLMLRSFINLQNVNIGFERNDILTARISLPAMRYGGFTRPTQFFRTLIEQLNSLPGVESASMASDTPLDNQNFAVSFSIENRTARPEEVMSASVRIIAPKYFHTMGVNMIEGREFDDSDGIKPPWGVIINRAMARRFWPTESPIGRIIRIDFPVEQKLFGRSVDRQIVGVAADIRGERLEAEASPALFVLHAQRPWARMTVVVRSRLPVASLSASLRNEIRQLDGNISTYNIKTMEQWISEAASRHRFAVFILNSFAILALIIAIFGIYSSVSCSISSRSKEFGIRMALGATSREIIISVLKQVGGLVLIGVIIGMGAAILLTRFLSALLYEVSPLNVSIYLLISASVILAALLATFLPAWKVTAAHNYLIQHLR